MHKITRAFGAAKLALRANSPAILVIGGVVAMGAAAIVAGVQARKMDKIVEPYVNEIESLIGTEEETQTARIDIYGRGGFEIVKLYAVPVVLFVGGAGMTFYGHNILVQRHATLAVAFTSLKKTFDAYRARVIATQGHEYDQMFMHGSTHIPNPGGAGMVQSRDWKDSGDDPYNRVFAQNTSSEWQNDLGSNKIFLGGMQRMSQNTLNHQGYLYLSEVYDSLGFAQSDVSRVVGWKIRILPDGSRDIPVVDFGLDKPIPDDWKYGQNREVYLDFNCQGLIVGGKVQKMLEQA